MQIGTVRLSISSCIPGTAFNLIGEWFAVYRRAVTVENYKIVVCVFHKAGLYVEMDQIVGHRIGEDDQARLVRPAQTGQLRSPYWIVADNHHFPRGMYTNRFLNNPPATTARWLSPPMYRTQIPVVRQIALICDQCVSFQGNPEGHLIRCHDLCHQLEGTSVAVRHKNGIGSRTEICQPGPGSLGGFPPPVITNEYGAHPPMISGRDFTVTSIRTGDRSANGPSSQTARRGDPIDDPGSEAGHIQLSRCIFPEGCKFLV